MIARSLAGAALSLFLAAPALAQGGPHGSHPQPAAAQAGALAIEQPWTRATPGGAKVAGGYLRIVNRGAEPDKLLGGAFARADRVEVHAMSMTDGIMRMRPLEGGLALPPGASVELKPNGYHLMFLGLSAPLKEGESIEGTLRFEKAGNVPVTFIVRSLGAQDAGASHHH